MVYPMTTQHVETVGWLKTRFQRIWHAHGVTLDAFFSDFSFGLLANLTYTHLLLHSAQEMS